MEIYLYRELPILKKQLKTARKTINKPVVNRILIPAPGREKLNTWDRGEMCQAGPRWRPNCEIAWHTERLLHHVRSTNSKRSPSSNAIKCISFWQMPNFFWGIPLTYKLYIYKVYLLLRDVKLLSRKFYLQVKHKYTVPPSEGCQTPSEGCH